MKKKYWLTLNALSVTVSPSSDRNLNMFENQPPLPQLNILLSMLALAVHEKLTISSQINPPLIFLQITQIATAFLLQVFSSSLFLSTSTSTFYHYHSLLLFTHVWEMNSLQFRYTLSPHSTRPQFSRTFPPHYYFPGNFGFLSFTGLNGRRSRKQIFSICNSSKTDSQIEKVAIEKNDERPPFDINLAVILAGFAFEAYTGPPVCFSLRLIFVCIWENWGFFFGIID